MVNTGRRRFIGPRAKLRRAQRKIQTLKESFEAFTSAHLYRVYSEFNEEEGYIALRAYSVGEEFSPPIVRWSVLIGEIAYNLRSALDQAVCELATERGDNCTGTQFPIFGLPPRPRKRETRGPRGRLNFRINGADIAPLSYRHRKIIEGVQPYHRRDSGFPVVPVGVRRPFYSLWLLHELNNADKHRALVEVDASPMGSALNLALDETIEYAIDPGAAVYDGAEVGSIWTSRAPQEVQVDGYLAIEVAFGKALPALDGWSVIQVLEWIARTVDNILYDLAVGQPLRTRAHLYPPYPLYAYG